MKALRRKPSRDKMSMPKWRGMATPMVRGTANTTGSAAGGINVMGQSADSGDWRLSGSRWSSQRAAIYRRILDILDCSINGRERDRPGHRQSRLETLGDNDNSLSQYMKVGFEDAKSWMERRLAKLRSGIPNSVATQLASGWAQQLSPELILPGITPAPMWNAWVFYTSPGQKGSFVFWEVK
jgi:hypothetical protein